MNKKQVEKNHYLFQKYTSEGRFISYYHQIKNILDFKNIKRILIIGKGDGIVPSVLKEYSTLFNLNLEIETFDIAEDLNPTYLGDIIEIDRIVKKKFDLILCCEVLEHIYFEEVIPSLKKLGEISEIIILSLPYTLPTIRISAKIPFFKEFNICIKIPYPRKKFFRDNDEHKWEIGPSISLSNFKKKIKRYFKISKSYLIKNQGFHYFFIIKSLKKEN